MGEPAPVVKAANSTNSTVVVAKQEAPKPKAAAPTDFPEDWMNPKNIMKYDIDKDPMESRIESTGNDVSDHRKFNLKEISLESSKKRTANQFLYITDDQ